MFSSPGTPKMNSTPSFSRQRTRSCAAVARGAFALAPAVFFGAAAPRRDLVPGALIESSSVGLAPRSDPERIARALAQHDDRHRRLFAQIGYGGARCGGLQPCRVAQEDLARVEGPGIVGDDVAEIADADMHDARHAGLFEQFARRLQGLFALLVMQSLDRGFVHE